ncbi:MAG: hypothetical protein HQL21_08060 [Candidatus Omnitrophica bacterium]|nr:hypothetical protein [Candidatus Omnitrophota bacterium]
MKNVLIFMCVVVFVAFSAWQVVLTQELIEKIASNYLVPYGYSMEVQGFKKGIFFSVGADQVILRKETRVVVIKAPEMLMLKQVRAHVGFLHAGIYGQAQMFGGEINASLGLTGQLKMEIHRADLGLIGETFSFKAAGSLDGNIDKEQVKFQLHKVRIDDSRSTSGFLPLNLFSEVKGLLVVSRKGVVIKSLLLEGPEGHANIIGNISEGYLEGVAEITPISEKNLDDLFIAYKTSQGNYKFPFKVSLNN